MDKKRILYVLLGLVAVVGVMLGVDFWQRQQAAALAPADMPPGSIPIFMDSKFVASFVPDDLGEVRSASFVDAEEGKTQEGWLLGDVILLYVKQSKLKDDTQVTVSSSSREKSKTLTWAEIASPDTNVLFDLSGRGTLKLASDIPGFDTRDDWVQDVDKIEITQP